MRCGGLTSPGKRWEMVLQGEKTPRFELSSRFWDCPGFVAARISAVAAYSVFGLFHELQEWVIKAIT